MEDSNINATLIDQAVPATMTISASGDTDSYSNYKSNNSNWIDLNSIDTSPLIDTRQFAVDLGRYGGYHNPALYGLQEKHKTYKVLHTILETCRDKNKYTVCVLPCSNSFCFNKNCSIEVSLHDKISISVFNNEIKGYETLEKIHEQANVLFSDCVSKFLNEHAFEFIELLESEAKKAVIETAKIDKTRLKEQLDLTESLEELGE